MKIQFSKGLPLEILDREGRVFEVVETCADTGCTTSIFHPDMLPPYVIKNMITSNVKIAGWKNQLTKALGEATLKVAVYGFSLKEEKKIRQVMEMRILVSEHLGREPLISRRDLIRWKRIPVDFPYVILDDEDYAWTSRLSDSEDEDESTACNVCEFEDRFWFDDDIEEIEMGRRAATSKGYMDFQTLLNDFPGVFDETDMKPMKVPPLRLKLKEDSDIVPLYVSTARKYPVHLEEAAKKKLFDLEKQGIIARCKEPTTWCSPAFFVPKKDGDVRFIADFSRLSKAVERPVHPFLCVSDALRSVPPGMKYFCTLDAKQGYFQIPLAQESQALTCFMTPWGRFMFLRLPMGMNSSGDYWCLSSDEVIEGIEHVYKIVDDILVCAATEKELYDKVRTILQRCREKNMKISKKKIQIGTNVRFAGHVVSGDGVKADETKFAAIRRMERPKTLTALRSFLGLAQQLAIGIPDLSHAAQPLRMLLKKNAAFVWTNAQEKSFQTVKDIITSDRIVSFFDPQKVTIVLTDASRLYGLGFLLMQKTSLNAQKHYLVHCNSRSLTDCETRYSATEVELLAVTYAIKDSKHYLLHCPKFYVYTDHRALVGLFQKNLPDIENTRLVRLREKVMQYSFEVTWVAGKTHLMADALSRQPVFSPTQEEKEESANASIISQRPLPDPLLATFLKWADADKDYQRLVKILADGKQFPSNTAYVSLFSDVQQHLSLSRSGRLAFHGHAIVVPPLAKPSVLHFLHRGHPGWKRMLSHAKSIFFWPGMANDLKNLASRCDACVKMTASKPRQTTSSPDVSTGPMQKIGIDLFQFETNHFMVVVDDFSSYIFVMKLTKLVTAAVTSKLLDIFYIHGFPKVIISDNGPQFRSEFAAFCEENGIFHSPSSPYYPQSNGLAEAGVKRAKHLMKKNEKFNSEYQPALFALMNTPTSGEKHSPSELFFNRSLRNPWLATDFHQDAEDDSNTPSNEDTVPFKVGDRVIIQDPKTRAWTLKGTISEITRTGSYQIDLEDGTNIRRNKSFIMHDRGHMGVP